MGMANSEPALWLTYLAEFVGTALLVLIGLSVVIFMFGPGSLPAVWFPDPWVRRLVTGFLFGSVGALIAISPLGRISGAHLDPVLSGAFWLVGSLKTKALAGYVPAQFLGAVVGAVLLIPIWGHYGSTVDFGMSMPAPNVPVLWSILGEMGATFCLVGGILGFVGHKRLQKWTPALIPPLVALLVAFEAPLSGTSMNPARSLGPALISGTWGVLWIDFAGPTAGALVAALLAARENRVHVAKIWHHGHDPLQLFHGLTRYSPALRAKGWIRSRWPLRVTG